VRFLVTSRKSKLYHLDGIAERLAQGAGEPGSRGAREGNGEEEDWAEAQLFVVRVFRDIVTISADSSGALLHRRGYRLATASAPLRETLAAAVLLGAEYRPGMALADPFCGSGTLVIEGALLSRRIAPGQGRSFAFQHWPSVGSGPLEQARLRSRERELPGVKIPIAGSDRDAGAIRIARENAERAGVAGDILFCEGAISAARPPAPAGLLATNPPYGVRLGETRELRDLYAAFGRVVREHWAGWRIAFLSAEAGLARETRLPLESRWRSRNGGIEIELLVGEPNLPST
jgi:putative N6-adenine-specific DNA methylase